MPSVNTYSRSQTTHLLLVLMTLAFVIKLCNGSWNSENINMVDNGVFLQLPFSNPPTVRPPPYSNSNEKCPGFNERENWIGNLCGDLNSGTIPINPLGHKFRVGSETPSYPFELIKNKTLGFFRHALPVLKNDKSLPKVARFNPYDYETKKKYNHNRPKRSAKVHHIHDGANTSTSAYEPIEPRVSTSLNYHHISNNNQQNRFCENPSLPTSALICRFYNAMWGGSNHHPQHPRQRIPLPHEAKNYRQRAGGAGSGNGRKDHYYRERERERDYLRQRPEEAQASASAANQQRAQSENAPAPSLPPTPCPSSAEYLTPVFARNHEGAWRYVVQIPKEGYFTQTVEVTKCTETNCYYIDGSCRTSPRWQSLLVAEVFYPDTEFPVSGKSSIAAAQQQKSSKRSKQNFNDLNGANSNQNEITIPPQCDGIDEIGCFQVRLFYDWFLIPGSCKCWKKQFDFKQRVSK